MASTRYQTEAARWNAVRARDPAADGTFVYCAKTTKIYCRPTCKARLARRSNVEFFTGASEAVSKGYRACKRCKPELEDFVPAADQAIDRIRLFLDDLADDAPLPKLDLLASDSGLTKYHFHRCFKRALGMTPREYALSRRQNRQIATGMTGEMVSEASTPSLVYDSIPSGSILTSASVDFNFDDWLADGIEEPLLVDENLASHSEENVFAPDQTFPTSLDSAVKAAITYDIHYMTVETTGGVLLMAFQDDQICKLELLTTLYEAIGSLEESFPTCIYVHHSAESLPDEQRLPIQLRVAAVVAALEHPLGEQTNSTPSWNRKVLDIEQNNMKWRHLGYLSILSPNNHLFVYENPININFSSISELRKHAIHLFINLGQLRICPLPVPKAIQLLETHDHQLPGICINPILEPSETQLFSHVRAKNPHFDRMSEWCAWRERFA